MRKDYIAPDAEITKFTVAEILYNASNPEYGKDPDGGEDLDKYQ